MARSWFGSSRSAAAKSGPASTIATEDDPLMRPLARQDIFDPL